MIMKHKISTALFLLSFAFGLIGVFDTSSDARQFRRAARIPGPSLLSVGRNAASLPALPGAKTKGQIRIPRRDVRRGLQKIFNQWGKGGLRGKLAWDFVNADRLVDVVRTFAPRDARVRVLAAANIQIFEQAILRGQAPDGRDLLVSRVSTTATTQVEFNDLKTRRFRQLRGTNDYVIQLFHAIERRKTR